MEDGFGKSFTEGESMSSEIDRKTGEESCNSYSKENIKSGDMESVRGVGKSKITFKESEEREDFGQCLLCKRAVSGVDGVCIGVNSKLPLSGLDLLSLLQCYSVSLTLQETFQLRKRTELCKECYEVVMEGDSAYGYIYSVASKMSRSWSGRLSKCVSFSLNVVNSQKHTSCCIYCEEKFQNECEWHFHMKVVHRMNVDFKGSTSSNGNPVSSKLLEKSMCKFDNKLTCFACCQSFKEQGEFLTHLLNYHKIKVNLNSKAVCKSERVNCSLDIGNKVGLDVDLQNATSMKIDSKSQVKERNILKYPPTLRHVFLAKQELMLQDKEDKMILSYLQGNVNIRNDIHKSNEQASCEVVTENDDADFSKSVASKKLYMQMIPRNKERDEGSRQIKEGNSGVGVTINLNSKESARTRRKLLTYRFSKRKSETILKGDGRKRSFEKQHCPYGSNKEPKRITKTLVQKYPMETKGKKLDIMKIRNDTYHAHEKCPQARDLHSEAVSRHIKREDDHLPPQDEETRSACGDDAVASMTNVDILDGNVEKDVDVSDEGGCAVVDIYNGPVDLCDVSDDFRCIIING